MPLVMDRVTEQHVLEFWKLQSSFDLQLPPHKSNCTKCFQKGKNQLIRIIREDAGSDCDDIEWWKSWESWGEDLGRERNLDDIRKAHFSDRQTYAELEILAKIDEKQLPLFNDPADQGMPCFCTD